MTSTSTDRRHGVNADAAVKVPCKAATTANITLSGEQTVDGVALVTGDRCLVKNQTTGANNGIYLVDTGSWTRDYDWDGSYDVRNGTLIYIISGTVSAGLFYVVTTADPITIGTTSVAFAVVSPSSPISLPLSLAQGGTSQSTKTTAAATLGLVQLTAAAGTANAQTATAPAGYTFATNDIFVYKPAATNTTATTLTLTPSGGGALSAKNVFLNGAALAGGELISGSSAILQYDGTQLQILGTSSLVTKTTAQTLTNKTLTAAVLGGTTDVSGGQLKFPVAQSASADANTLDDYEEGTWTPSIGGSATYTTQVGYYTKIGNIVFFNYQLQINVLGTGNTTTISGLPFTSAGASTNFSHAVQWQTAATTFVNILGQIATGSTNIILNGVTAATASVSSVTGVLGNGTVVTGTGSYRTT